MMRSEIENTPEQVAGSMVPGTYSISVECVICRACNGRFDTDQRRPLVMSCGHSICAKCSRDFVPGKSNLKNCPSCKLAPASSPKENYDMIGYMKMMKKREESQSPNSGKQRQVAARTLHWLHQKNVSLIRQLSTEKDDQKATVDDLNAKIKSLQEKIISLEQNKISEKANLDSEYKRELEDMRTLSQKLESEKDTYYLEGLENKRLLEELKLKRKNERILADAYKKSLEIRVEQLEYEQEASSVKTLKAEVASLTEEKKLLSQQLGDMKQSANDALNAVFIENEVQKKFMDYQRTFVLFVLICLLLAYLTGVCWRMAPAQVMNESRLCPLGENRNSTEL